MHNDFLASGQFSIGCNYWASHAGTAMWRNWQPDVMLADLQQMQAAGLQLIRVFPLWPDFQPLHALRVGGGEVYEYRFGEQPLPDTTAGQAGVAAIMLERFHELADMAAAQGLQIIVGLVTGWMSGRLFAPPAFSNLNVLTHPAAVMWQARFVSCFVNAFKHHPAISAWDLGNECNAMGSASREQAWLWTRAITGAIRQADPSRPIVSGMHSLEVDLRTAWSIRDQAELTDILTTHPYPFWVRHVDADPVDTIRPILHASAESCLYADIGGKPCFAEEIGTMGPGVASDEHATAFLQASVANLWAHDCRAALWWCAYDQDHLEDAPYDWVAVERKLGLFRNDRSPKPVLQGLSALRTNAVAQAPVLPPRLKEAVCVLTEGQDQWAVALNSFILAKQAGFDLQFRAADQPLPQAPLYLLPCVSGIRPIHRRRWLELLERVREGATLYISFDNAATDDLNQVAGIEVQSRQRVQGAQPYTLKTAGNMYQLETNAAFQLNFITNNAEVMAENQFGQPIMTRCGYGKGTVFFLAAPLELDQALTPGAYTSGKNRAAWRVYQAVSAAARAQRIVGKTSPMIGCTEHPISPTERMVVLVNLQASAIREHIQLQAGWSLREAGHESTTSSHQDIEIDMVAFGTVVLNVQQL
jgi:hypothetical protein